MSKYNYSNEHIINSLKKVGVTKGDNLFIYSNIGFFGRLKDADTREDYYRIFKEAIFETILGEGTLIVPTFTYSFCNDEVFNKDETPSICGFFSEMVRQDHESVRSDDANFSVAAIGKNAEYFTKEAPEYSFGKNSIWDRFLDKNGKFCNFNFDSGSTFIHYVEKMLKVSYRYDKGFPGTTLKAFNRREEKIFYHFVYDLEKPNNGPDFSKFDKKAKEFSITKVANVGKGQIVLISARDTFNLVKEELDVDPAFLIKGNEIQY